jgi:predicted nucleotidyltransferase
MKFLDDAKIPNYPYPELREVLSAFVNEISSELAGNIIGIYLVGSIATGDFDLDSDVDFLVVTKTELTETNIESLQEIQVKIYNIDYYPAKHLEGSFINIEDLNNWCTVGEKELYYFDNGSTTIEKSIHDNKWHVRWILRERGVTLIGQKPETIMSSIPIRQLSDEIKSTMLQKMEEFQDVLSRPLCYLNSRFGQSFTVLTYCRMLHTLHTGTVQSKKAAVKWAKQFFEPKWVAIIDLAWKERKGVRFMEKIRQRAEQKTLHETMDFIKHAVNQIEKVEE